MILPDRRLHFLLGLLLLLAIVASLWAGLLSLWWLLALILMSVAIGDGLLLFAPVNVQITRQLDGALPLGVWQTINLHIEHHHPRPLHLRLFDHVPPGMQFDGLPGMLTLASDQSQRMSYRVRPRLRGDFVFAKIQVHVRSPLKLWWRNLYLPVANSCKVYPNFTAVSQYDLLAMENRLGQLGVRRRQRRGDGQDFLQLRDYRHGDSMRQIDWKATSRMRKLIARDYQEERNQDIIILLDCSHRMQAQDGELSHFDHSLNAIMLLAHVAIRQGDDVGVATFSGTERWLSPVKGRQGFDQVLHSVYDLQPGNEAPDFFRAATTLLQRHKKRALVILVTNIQDQDSDDLSKALDLLARRHLLVLASLRETILDDTLQDPVNSFVQSLRHAALHHYLSQREAAFKRLPQKNAFHLDVTPSHLSTTLINQYFSIKRSGRL